MSGQADFSADKVAAWAGTETSNRLTTMGEHVGGCKKRLNERNPRFPF